ncbi:hypothetical protein VTI74DRAFT_4787 [Chaetomium olivicolor]
MEQDNRRLKRCWNCRGQSQLGHCYLEDGKVVPQAVGSMTLGRIYPGLFMMDIKSTVQPRGAYHLFGLQ